MSDMADELFGDLAEEYYPGSKRKRSAPPPPPRSLSTTFEEKPKYSVGGVDYFTIGQLARALNRRPVTIRSWEAKGVLPKARYRTPTGSGGMGEGRRLYTRRQVEGLIALCAEHGILEFGARPDRIPPGFTPAVIELWKEPPA